MNKRPSWDEYFIEIAHITSKRSTCCRRKVGAVIVRDNHILSTGYNGAPSKLPHCEEVGCLREILNIPSGQRHEICRGLHAEQNAIIQSAVEGISTKNATLYCTTKPCSICTKMIINSQIIKIVYEEEYDDPLAMDLLSEANIEIFCFKK